MEGSQRNDRVQAVEDLRVDEDGLLAELAEALEAPIGPATSSSHVIAQLGRALAARRDVLVVFDNFEQLAGSAEATLGRWLRAASQTRFLVTSRVALGLAGEHLWPLRPLQLPPPELRDAARLAAIEAVDLFIRRARQLRPDLLLRQGDLAAIADVVRRFAADYLAAHGAAMPPSTALAMSPWAIRQPAAAVLPLAPGRLLMAGPRGLAAVTLS